MNKQAIRRGINIILLVGTAGFIIFVLLFVPTLPTRSREEFWFFIIGGSAPPLLLTTLVINKQYRDYVGRKRQYNSWLKLGNRTQGLVFRRRSNFWQHLFLNRPEAEVVGIRRQRRFGLYGWPQGKKIYTEIQVGSMASRSNDKTGPQATKNPETLAALINALPNDSNGKAALLLDQGMISFTKFKLLGDGAELWQTFYLLSGLIDNHASIVASGGHLGDTPGYHCPGK